MSVATTFCTCIEAGFLEQQVVLLARSLRALPSDFARAELIAVQPRKGPGIARETRRNLSELGVRYVSVDLMEGYAWSDFMTKTATMAWAEQHASTPYVTWVDGDILFVRSPDALLPTAEFGFAGPPGEADLGTNGKDGNAAYWNRVADLFGIPLESGITMPAADTGKEVYEYYNSGVYTVRCEEAVSARQLRYFKLLLQAKLASQATGMYFNDMVALAMAARSTKRERHTYGLEMNFHLQPDGYNPITEAHVDSITLLHYHGSFFSTTPAVAALIDRLPQDVQSLVRAHTPFQIGRMRLDRRVRRKVLSALRARRLKRFDAECVRI